MVLSAKASNYDYTVHDANGISGFKDGVKYFISKEDWDRENPHIEHRDSGCKECTFVQDQQSLFKFFVQRDLKEKAGQKPVFVGKFTMPDWVGHSGFYLFKCLYCAEVCFRYTHMAV